jgi:hypothetical protein
MLLPLTNWKPIEWAPTEPIFFLRDHSVYPKKDKSPRGKGFDRRA